MLRMYKDKLVSNISTVVCIYFLFCSSIVLKASDSLSAQFQSALDLQKKEQLSEALQVYLSILEKNSNSPEIHYNIALLYHNLGNIGRSILHFEKALNLDPLYVEARQNLKIVQEEIGTPNQASKEPMIMEAFKSMAKSMSINNWLVVLYMLMCLFLFFLFLQRKTMIPKNKLLNIIFAMGLLFVFSLATTAHLDANQSYGIVLSKEIGLRMAPSLASEEIRLISEGYKVSILEIKDSWMKIQLDDYQIGWVSENLIAKI